MNKFGNKHPSEGLRIYQVLFGNISPEGRTLDRASLPSPMQYLSEQGLLKGAPRGGWVQITCPVHKDGNEKHPSMSVNMTDGHFRCHTCGVKGGDLIALHRLITGLPFRDAVRDMGGRFHD